jgi:hypothetical protein
MKKTKKIVKSIQKYDHQATVCLMGHNERIQHGPQNS